MSVLRHREAGQGILRNLLKASTHMGRMTLRHVAQYSAGFLLLS